MYEANRSYVCPRHVNLVKRRQSKVWRYPQRYLSNTGQECIKRHETKKPKANGSSSRRFALRKNQIPFMIKVQSQVTLPIINNAAVSSSIIVSELCRFSLGITHSEIISVGHGVLAKTKIEASQGSAKESWLLSQLQSLQSLNWGKPRLSMLNKSNIDELKAFILRIKAFYTNF